jgi:hypothetical protein
LNEVVIANRHKDPVVFDEIGGVLSTLGYDNASSDETDTEESYPEGSLKRVRHVNLPWLHKDIVGMKRSLEKLGLPRASALHKSGNPGCVRLAKSTKDSQRVAPGGLPSNWYNPPWLAQLSDVERDLLEPSEERAIPELVCPIHCFY